MFFSSTGMNFIYASTTIEVCQNDEGKNNSPAPIIHKYMHWNTKRRFGALRIHF